MAQEITSSLVWQWLPQRKADSHKGSYGNLLAVCGSDSFRGAAVLCSLGALRTGCGILTVACTQTVASTVMTHCPEAVLLVCKQSSEGGLYAGDTGQILGKLAKFNALVLGPGLGNTAGTSQIVELLASAAAGHVVLDADALNAVAGLPQLPRPVERTLVLTPHPGEMARLCGLTIAEVNANRESIAAGYARANQCVVVLKGHHTIVAGPDGQVLRNSTGNPGLARGGSGDVLSGMIGSFLAQGLSPLHAAACGVWLHGAAADRTAQRLGQYGMLPQDIFQDLGQLFAENGR
ncbi:MAG: NAD(P)H-hydrate dehydratase [Candidatus Fournierella pullistercoris]|uniref:ADP-dependent (S)-NAD(P)H-hydrate dehydratase n=1 Tax=Candidatus Allofournierella pullistercoris TaxID=2838597 RepID=A0A948T1L5_9FIRM|nr:NAD(P)H-hydrate dehydratase [Candidatus Fournierella pullistercoris]